MQNILFKCLHLCVCVCVCIYIYIYVCVCVCVCCCLVFKQCSTVCNPMDCSLLSSSVYGIFQVRILDYFAISSSRVFSRPRDWTHVSHVFCIIRQILYHWATRGAPCVCVCVCVCVCIISMCMCIYVYMQRNIKINHLINNN